MSENKVLGQLIFLIIKNQYNLRIKINEALLASIFQIRYNANYRYNKIQNKTAINQKKFQKLLTSITLQTSEWLINFSD